MTKTVALTGVIEAHILRRELTFADAVHASPLGRPFFADRSGSGGWTLNDAQVFMAIPFSDAYEEFYYEVVASAVREVGLEPIRIDQVPQDGRHRPITDRIEEAIARCRFVVADMSGFNPNVVYEIGLAAGISKPLLMLCQSAHFDNNEIPLISAPTN